MDQNILNFALAIGTIQLLAVASPGPDFALVTKTSLLHGKNHGFAVTFGIVLGICIHLIAAQTGFSLIIVSTPQLMKIIQYGGAGYLLYIGFQCLKSIFNSKQSSPNENEPEIGVTYFQQIRIGFITNILNPKAMLYFLSLSSQIANPNLSHLDKLILCFVILIVSTFWFSFCSIVLTQQGIKSKFLKLEKAINLITGLAFVFFAIGLILHK